LKNQGVVLVSTGVRKIPLRWSDDLIINPKDKR